MTVAETDPDGSSERGEAMALFSDVDWLVIAVVAAFLFLGPNGRQFARQMGRWYARALRLKDELLNAVIGPAPPPIAPGSPTVSVAATLFGRDEPRTPRATSNVAPAISWIIAPVPPVGVWSVGTEVLGAGMGAGTWWTTTSIPGEVVRLR